MEHKHKNIDIDNDKIWAMLAYILFPIPLIFAKDKTAFVKYHINQGLILFIFSFVGQIILGISRHFPFSVLNFIFNAFCIVLFVVGIINVVKKKEKPLPLIGKWFSFLK